MDRIFGLPYCEMDIDIDKISIFDSLLMATGAGSSGLEADDRRFYYDPVYDKINSISV